MQSACVKITWQNKEKSCKLYASGRFGSVPNSYTFSGWHIQQQCLKSWKRTVNDLLPRIMAVVLRKRRCRRSRNSSCYNNRNSNRYSYLVLIMLLSLLFVQFWYWRCSFHLEPKSWYGLNTLVFKWINFERFLFVSEMTSYTYITRMQGQYSKQDINKKRVYLQFICCSFKQPLRYWNKTLRAISLTVRINLRASLECTPIHTAQL